MSTYKAPKRVSKRTEAREDKLATFFDRSLYFYEENKTLVFGALGGLVVVILAIFGFMYYQGQQQGNAASQMTEATALYEAGNYRAALDGDNGAPGLLEIVDRFGSTKAGNLARFYAGDALLKLGDYEQALEYFQDFKKDNDAIGAAAYAGEAAVYESMGEYARAAERFEEAADQFENEFTAARYLHQAGRNYVMAGEFAEARTAYEDIKERYPASQTAAEVDFYLAQLEAKAAG